MDTNVLPHNLAIVCDHCKAAVRGPTADLLAIWMVQHAGGKHQKPLMYSDAYKAVVRIG